MFYLFKLHFNKSDRTIEITATTKNIRKRKKTSEALSFDEIKKKMYLKLFQLFQKIYV